MKWTVVSVTNNENILKSCLLESGETLSASEFIQKTGYKSASVAYNSAIEESTTDVLIFVHQDVYLPKGWAAALETTLAVLSSSDPKWGVLGIWGVGQTGERSGHLFCNASGSIYGRPFDGVQEVRTLDEVLLVVRKSSGLKFDEELQGFHMYGTDICLTAERERLKCYAISAFCIHNANTYNFLPLSFWASYFFIRRKWLTALPVTTPCITITRWCWPLIRWNIARIKSNIVSRQIMRKRVEHPEFLYRELSEHGLSGKTRSP